MSWDYANAINSLDLSDVATFSTIENEVPAPHSDPGVVVPGRDGVQFDPDSSFSPLIVSLRVHLRWTDSTGAVTHTDGEVGHIRENLSLIKRELSKPAPVYSRTLEHIGDVRAVVKANTPGFVGEQRHVYHFPLTIPAGSWQAAAEESDSGNPPTGVTTDGDRRIFDPRISLSASGAYTVTDADGLVYTITGSAGPTYPVVVDVGAGTVLDDNGVDVRGDVEFSHQHWLRLSPDHTHVVTGNCEVFWRNRWA